MENLALLSKLIRNRMLAAPIGPLEWDEPACIRDQAMSQDVKLCCSMSVRKMPACSPVK